MLLPGQQLLAMIDLMGIPFGLFAIGSVIAVALLLYFGCERYARRSLDRAYAGLEIHSVAAPNDVVLVYQTYHGFLIWYIPGSTPPSAGFPRYSAGYLQSAGFVFWRLDSLKRALVASCWPCCWGGSLLIGSGRVLRKRDDGRASERPLG